MNFEPHTFFIGLVDFFSVLLPGAPLIFLMMGKAAQNGTGVFLCSLTGAEAKTAMLCASTHSAKGLPVLVKGIITNDS